MEGAIINAFKKSRVGILLWKFMLGLHICLLKDKLSILLDPPRIKQPDST
jgi:hypothetical protein